MTKSTEMFIALLRLSLAIDKNERDLSSVFVQAENDDWEQLFKLSVKQGAILLSYGGLQYLSAELQPPRKLKLRWCVNVVKGSERHDRYKGVVAKLANVLSTHGIDTMVIKGITISELYTVPSFREGGDIDLYLFGEGEKGNQVMSSLGLKKSEFIPKNSTFVLEGIPIENHYTFFDTNLRFKREGELYQRMEKKLLSMFSKETCPKSSIDNVLQLPPQAGAFFLIGHTFRHFCGLDMNIRQMCDWVVFFNKYENEIDAEALSSSIEELGLAKFTRHINAFCANNLGFEPYFNTPSEKDYKAQTFILKTILRYRVAPKVHIPMLDVFRYLFRRNNIYKRYLGNIKNSEFLLPEIKSYFSYLCKNRWKSKDSKSPTLSQ